MTNDQAPMTNKPRKTPFIGHWSLVIFLAYKTTLQFSWAVITVLPVFLDIA